MRRSLGGIGLAFVVLAATLPLRAAELADKAATPVKTIKVLTVGNSFAENALRYFSDIAAAGGKKALVFRANLGGHSLEQHAKYLKAYEANPSDPVGIAYKQKVHPVTGEKKDYSLRQALESETWDFVTIQQYSVLSYKPETYEPYAKELVEYIRKYSPKSEILVHETWAYRDDDSLFKDGNPTQKAMYESLKAAYEKLCADYGLRMLPSGDAFWLARSTERWSFKADPNFDYKNPPEGKVPDQKTSLHGGYNWGKDKEGKPKFGMDGHHANKFGEFLAGCVWYEVMFGENVENNTFVPPGFTEDDAKSLRKIAHQAVAARAVKK